MKLPRSSRIRITNSWPSLSTSPWITTASSFSGVNGTYFVSRVSATDAAKRPGIRPKIRTSVVINTILGTFIAAPPRERPILPALGFRDTLARLHLARRTGDSRVERSAWTPACQCLVGDLRPLAEKLERGSLQDSHRCFLFPLCQ